MQPHISSERLSPIKKGGEDDRISFGKNKFIHFLGQYVLFPVNDNLKIPLVTAALQKQAPALRTVSLHHLINEIAHSASLQIKYKTKTSEGLSSTLNFKKNEINFHWSFPLLPEFLHVGYNTIEPQLFQFLFRWNSILVVPHICVKLIEKDVHLCHNLACCRSCILERFFQHPFR